MAKSNSIELKIGDCFGNMTSVEKNIADYVLSHLKDVPYLSIKELSALCGASEASVLRFCKTIGYKGYRDFTISLSSVLGSSMKEKKDTPMYTDIQLGDSIATIIQNVTYNNVKSLEDSLSVTDENQIKEAIDVLCRTNNVCWFGFEASGIVCEDAVQKFSRINKPYRAYTDTHSIKAASAILNKDDAAVFISNSGETPEILDALDLVKETGAKVIAITRYSNSTLAIGSDICLRISTPEVTFRSAAMGSRIAMLNIVDILFSAVASETYSSIKNYLDKTREAIAYRKH